MTTKLFRLQPEELQEFYDMVDSGNYTQKELAEWFGISVYSVRKYMYNRNYTEEEYVERKEFLEKRLKRAAPGLKRRIEKLLKALLVCYENQQKEEAIRIMFQTGNYYVKEVAQYFNMPIYTVNKIINK